MIVAGLVVETRADTAEQVAARLGAFPGVEVHGSNPHGVAITWSGEDKESLDRVSEQIVTGDADIVGIYPTYLGDGESDAETRATAT